jgi:UDP-N-acetylglucosamine/UDP-N-acetylgalactosamine diphosphorylase
MPRPRSATAGPAARVARLVRLGVRVIDPRQTFIGSDVDPGRIDPTATLHPGTRLEGARTFVGPGAVLGREGPATLVNTVLGEGATVASGYVEGAVLLRGARLGADAHVREGTLLEEEASTAHAVGLKHSVLLAFVTLGSLINFCDVLMAGGTSRREHSEVGSGFIHFNFTPWGRSGDKATPSLVGDVVHGVFLDQPRIFLGGAGGMVGPRTVGYGSVVGAGQVLRRDVPAGRLVVTPPSEVDQPAHEPRAGRFDRVREQNARYLGHLWALREWYRHVRTAHLPDPAGSDHHAVVIREAIATLDLCIAERWNRLRGFLEEHGQTLAVAEDGTAPPCPLPAGRAGEIVDHVAWVRRLSTGEVERGREWLQAIVDRVVRTLLAHLP